MSFLRSMIPSPVRSLPWRLQWLAGTDAYAKRPTASIAKLLHWTTLELLDRDAEFVTADGHRLKSTSRNFTSLSVHLTGTRDSEFQAFIARRLHPANVFIDIGANVGVYSVFASNLVGEAGQVLSIEANPVTYAYLADNISRNGLRNVVPLNCAVGDETGTLRIAANTRNAGETHVATSSETGAVVEVKRVDDLLKEQGVSRVDYIKIYVEGFELPVLRGAKETIAANAEIVVQTELVDAHAQRYGHSVSDIVALMTGLGLKPFQPDATGRAVEITTADITEHCDVLWMR